MSDPQTPDLGALSRVFAVINGKGGVLKTSVAANVGALLAAAGWKVLEIDLDVSGNLKLDFGLTDEPEDDMGRGLVEAIWYGEKGLPVVKDVRTNLDFVYGGRGLEQLGGLARSSMVDDLPTGSLAGEFARALTEVPDDYDLILLDCPPGNSEIQDMALAVARWVLIPTKTDQASLDGLRTVGPRVKRARRTQHDGHDQVALPVCQPVGAKLLHDGFAARQVGRPAHHTVGFDLGHASSLPRKSR